MENFIELIGIIVVMFFIFGARILKAFAKGKKASNPKLPPPKASAPSKQSADARQAVEQLLMLQDDGSLISEAEVKALLGETEALLVRAEDLLSLSRSRGEETAKLAPEIETILVLPLRHLKSGLESNVASGELPLWSEGQRARTSLSRFTRLTNMLTQMVEYRVHPATAEILGLLDKAASECIRPYREHATRMRIPYSTTMPITLLGEPSDELTALLENEHIAPVFVKQQAASLPRTWINTASDMYLDAFYSTSGLKQKISTDLGVMAAPLGFNHYGDPRSFSAGLLGGMLPRIFADTAAALLLGPGFAAGLLESFTKDAEPIDALSIRIGHRSIVPPYHVRMMVALRVLDHLGLEEEAKKRRQSWIQHISGQENYIVQDDGARQAKVRLTSLHAALVKITDYLVAQPLQPLGNLSLLEIPHLACDQNRMRQMELAVTVLLAGETVPAPGHVVIAAAQLAYEKSNTLEGRIVTGALSSLRGGSVQTTRRAVTGPGPKTWKERIRSRDFVTRAIVTGAALAPRNARLRAQGRYR